MSTGDRPLRADAERSVRAILAAAERVLRANPAASMEDIAEEAGVARTTVHRRFATREALIAAMATAAMCQIAEAVDAVSSEMPPMVALHQATANVLRVKVGLRFAVGHISPDNAASNAIHERITERCDEQFARARDAGLVRGDVDLIWARRAYYALIEETLAGADADDDPDRLATRIVDTLLRGIGTNNS